MGMLRELYFCRTALEEDLGNHRPAEIKRQIIQENIYGVDIEKGAVDIARLRFWLALVVDEPTPHALPNLDFKIMQGNSLLENYKGVPLDSLLSDKTVMPKKAKQGRFAFDKREMYSQGELAFGGQTASDVITSLMKEYYATDNRDRKQRILDDINAQVKGYIKDQINNSDLHAEIDALECQNDKFFLWHTWFADVIARGGFDIVIGNPPYFNVETLGAKSQYAKAVKETYPEIWQDKSDILFYFFGLAMRLSKNVVMYITSNAYPFSDKAKKLRNALMNDGRLKRIINFEKYNIFNSASITTCITELRKFGIGVFAANFTGTKGSLEEVIDYILSDSNYFEVTLSKDSVFALVTSDISAINAHIDANHKRLNQIVVVGSGMQTAANNVFAFDSYPKLFPSECIKKRVTGENIKKYLLCDSMEEFLLYIEPFQSFEDLPQPVQDYLNANKKFSPK